MTLQTKALVGMFAAFVAGTVVALLSGCSSPPTYEFDEMDSTATQVGLVEFSLGKYEIPIPVSVVTGSAASQMRNRLEFVFELHALIADRDRSHVVSLWNRHEGTVRDRVIRVCRNATLDELSEPELGTLKQHLTDAIQAELGSKKIRRLLVSEVETRKI